MAPGVKGRRAGGITGMGMSQAKTPLIAVVDDEKDVRGALSRLLRSAGFDVLTFGSGEEFLSYTEERAPDCIVLDLHMHGGSGFDVQRSLADSKLPMPVVILTGNDTRANRACALANGADAFLTKPVDDELLIDTIVAVTRGRPA